MYYYFVLWRWVPGWFIARVITERCDVGACDPWPSRFSELGGGYGPPYFLSQTYMWHPAKNEWVWQSISDYGNWPGGPGQPK